MLPLTHVSLHQLRNDLVVNGTPGAEKMTTEFIVMAGSIAIPPGSAITQPANQKLNNEYEYYMTEMRLSARVIPGTPTNLASGIAGVPYIAATELENVTLQLTADGRSRNVFRQTLPFSQFIDSSGNAHPFHMPIPVAFNGAETVIAQVATTAAWNPGATAAVLTFTLTLVCGIILKSAISR